MKKLLLVIDMQNDFITGALGSPQAQAIVPNVKEKIEQYRKNGDKIIFTRDTHSDNYPATQEGKYLPVPHCIKGTPGHQIAPELDAPADAPTPATPATPAGAPNTPGIPAPDCEIFDKPNFGSLELAELVAKGDYEQIELCGLCTDICVVSNALILKARLPETEITLDPACCAGVTEESHRAALQTMKMCQINVIMPPRPQLLSDTTIATRL